MAEDEMVVELDTESHLGNYLESDCITCLVQLSQFLVTITGLAVRKTGRYKDM